MLLFSQTADRIAATTKKLEKTAILAEYFRSVPVEDASVAAVFFSGRPFPVWEETTLQVGGSILWRIVAELAGKSEHALTEAYRKHGDLGAVAEAVLPEVEARSGSRPRLPSDPKSPIEIQRIFREIAAARRPAFKAVIVKQFLEGISPLEAKYVIKIMTGDLRIGLKESLVEEAIAKAFAERHPETTLKAVQRANMLLGDIGETLKLAAGGCLAEAKMRLFHPIGFMLASPAESAADALSYFQNAWVEDKYDGIRAQAHCSGDDVRFFSRTRDEITESFPELPDALAALPSDAILDGEILAWDYLGGAEFSEIEEGRAHSPVPEKTFGRALPFSALQKRLGRKMVSDALIREVPVTYVVFDVLYANGELVIDKPLRERAKILDELLAKTPHHRGKETLRRKTKTEVQRFLDFRPAESPEPITDNHLPTTNDQRLTMGLRTTHDVRRATYSPILDEQQPTPAVIRAPVFQASSPDALNALFDAAQARGNEGLMIKDPESSYSPGRRGKSWLKLKRELATLDVVVTAVEFGHGRRIGVLSDYTFAVRDGDQLLNVGKAYSGLTDTEIAEMTKWFLDHTIEDQGFRRVVEPKIVIEVAFNNIMQSDRHNSGYALRFPRIVRLRPDKLPEEADTLGRVKEIYRKQNQNR
jgi:ATP-dependent DNA ligase